MWKLCRSEQQKLPIERVNEVKRLLDEKRVNVNLANDEEYYKRSALHYAAENGHLELIKLLVQTGEDVNIADNDGETALHWAALNNHMEAAKLLFNLGIDANKTNNLGWSAYQWAKLRNHTEMMKLLNQANDGTKNKNIENQKLENIERFHVAILPIHRQHFSMFLAHFINIRKYLP